jgi:hypothetical protein
MPYVRAVAVSGKACERLELTVPYGFSDAGVAIARLPSSSLLEAMLSEGVR